VDTRKALVDSLNADLKRVCGQDTDRTVTDLRAAPPARNAPPPPRPHDEDLEDQSGKADTVSGDTARGVVIRESKSEVWVDTTPCGIRGESRVVGFHEPMRRTAVGTVTCRGKIHPRIEVRQN
jgi:hypothetical protein